MLVDPLAVVWPSGWAWHAGAPHESQYFMMIVGLYATLGVFLINAARNAGEPQPYLVRGVVIGRARRHHGGAVLRRPPRHAHGASVGRRARAASGRNLRRRSFGRRASSSLLSRRGPDAVADDPDRFCGRAAQVDGGAWIFSLASAGLIGHRDHAREVTAGQHHQPRIQGDADTVEVPQHLRVGVGDPGDDSRASPSAHTDSCRASGVGTLPSAAGIGSPCGSRLG